MSGTEDLAAREREFPALTSRQLCAPTGAVVESAMTYEFRNAGRLHRAMRQFGALAPVSWFFARTLHHMDRAVYRATKGRTTVASVLAGLPIMMLTTTGARTGQQRTVPLLAIPDGGSYVVIASNYGQPKAAGWGFNLRAHPKATVAFEGRRMDVVAQELTGAERERLYERGIEIYPGWVHYRKRVTRTIPVFRLTPVK